MCTRTPHSDSTAPEATWYDAIPTTLPLPLVVGAAVGVLSPFPISSTVGANGLISATVLTHGLLVATSKSATGPANDPGAPVETDAPLDGVTIHVRDNVGQNRRRGSV